MARNQLEYDAWGKVLSVTDDNGQPITDPGHIGNLNPIRYRGYYYDTDTGLYYLKSRYYDPETGRFLNADGVVSTGQGLFAGNMFAYCNNDPVNRLDPAGTKSISAIYSEVSARSRQANPSATWSEGNQGVAIKKSPTWSEGNHGKTSSSSSSKPKAAPPKLKPSSPVEGYKVTFASNAYSNSKSVSSSANIPAEVIFAQACLESGYGTSIPYVEGHNVFNLKGVGPAGSVSMSALEWDSHGNKYYEDSLFRAYNNEAESYADYANLLNKNYRKYLKSNTINGWADALLAGGYATDPSYKNLLLGVISFWEVG